MLVDSHCHLPNLRHKQETADILERARQNGVEKVINVGTSIKESQEAVEVAQEFNNVYATAGIYPHSDKDKDLKTLKTELRNLLACTQENKIVGIGECGIDITDWANGRSEQNQIALFEMQLSLAARFNLPIVIHNRNGKDQVLTALTRHKNQNPDQNLRGVMHCFAYDWEFAQKTLDLGLYISFSGFVTYNNKNDLLEVVRKVPDDRFLLETDSPYNVPKPLTDKSNEPKNVKIVGQKVAEIKCVSFEKIAELSYRNSHELFNLT